MKKRRIYSILAIFFSFINLKADQVIILTMAPYPVVHESPEAKRASEKLKKAGRIHKLGIKALGRNPVTKGIFSTYAGWLGMSNHDGQTTFLYKHTNPLVYLVITNKITPIMMAGNTIHHWTIEQNNEAKMYKMERLQQEQEGLFYWLTEEVSLPENGVLPNESITILTKPKDVYVPEGVTLAENSPNLVLPTIYIKKGIKTNSNALYILNLRQFFGKLHPAHKATNDRNITLLGE